MKPTLEQFNAFQALFDYFNKELFNDTLPNIILNLSHSRPNVGGFFSPKRWKIAKEGEEETIHEISLNPESFRKDKKDVVSTLVHEMVHLWQEVHGEHKPSGGYHNKEWGTKMENIGLMPSNTGFPGGKRTGVQMTHYIIPNGSFDTSYEKMDKSILLPFDHITILKGSTVKRNKVKYICPCDNKVWGKPGLVILCEDCKKAYREDV